MDNTNENNGQTPAAQNSLEPAAVDVKAKEKEFSITWHLKVLSIIYVILGILYIILKIAVK